MDHRHNEGTTRHGAGVRVGLKQAIGLTLKPKKQWPHHETIRIAVALQSRLVAGFCGAPQSELAFLRQRLSRAVMSSAQSVKPNSISGMTLACPISPWFSRRPTPGFTRK